MGEINKIGDLSIAKARWLYLRTVYNLASCRKVFVRVVPQEYLRCTVTDAAEQPTVQN